MKAAPTTPAAGTPMPKVLMTKTALTTTATVQLPGMTLALQLTTTELTERETVHLQRLMAAVSQQVLRLIAGKTKVKRALTLTTSGLRPKQKKAKKRSTQEQI